MQPCKMISLDSSTSNTGFAIWQNAALTSSGCFNKEKVLSESKLKEMILAVLSLLKAEKPDIVVTELTVVPRNAAAQRTLSMLLGAVYAWCVLHNAEYASLYPTHWRKLIYGENTPKGTKALKERAIETVKECYGIETDNDNIAEAILIGEARIREFNSNFAPTYIEETGTPI